MSDRPARRFAQDDKAFVRDVFTDARDHVDPPISGQADARDHVDPHRLLDGRTHMMTSIHHPKTIIPEIHRCT
ncbi:hypothetical protein [Longimicrobium terrae]|uniref:Uncharacterized protein n=1 Tax=Longimicrobium terrae TaxID=1639882 RepID=A0A841H3U6_9BACT|nr:hypothetical protein [Longimicrobium terrae]MBB4638645.1 hypothetical protein [Longimicrobium terrae]MBB6072885.1 hypothetical protein [Longimicrobium terrae]